MESLYTILNRSLNATFHLGLSPIYWDKVSYCARVTSPCPSSSSAIKDKVRYYKWKVTLLATIFIECWVIQSFIATTRNPEFRFTSLVSILNLLSVVSAGTAVLFHCHTAIRRHDLCALINGLISWSSQTRPATATATTATTMTSDVDVEMGQQQQDHQQHYQSVKTKVKLEFYRNCHLVTKVNNICFYSFLSMSIASPGFYFVDCEMHMLGMILPVCNDYTMAPHIWWYQNPINLTHFILMCILQFLWAWFQGVSLFAAVIAISLGTTFCWSAMKKSGSGSHQSHLSLVHTFRTIQIISGYLDTCFGGDLFPIFVLSISGTIILLVPISISADQLATKCLGLFNCGILGSMLFVFLHFGSKFNCLADGTMKGIRSRGPAVAAGVTTWTRSGYMRQVVMSLEQNASFRVRIGPFFYLSRGTTVAVGSVVVENACSLLILMATTARN